MHDTRWPDLFKPELKHFKLTRTVLRGLKPHGRFRSGAGINSLSSIINLYGGSWTTAHF